MSFHSTEIDPCPDAYRLLDKLTQARKTIERQEKVIEAARQYYRHETDSILSPRGYDPIKSKRLREALGRALDQQEQEG